MRMNIIGETARLEERKQLLEYQDYLLFRDIYYQDSNLY
jgi:hypothetical protein